MRLDDLFGDPSAFPKEQGMNSAVAVPPAVFFEQGPDPGLEFSVLVFRQQAGALVEIAAPAHLYAVKQVFQRMVISQGVDQMQNAPKLSHRRGA